MDIFDYEVLNPVTDSKKPHLDRRGFFVVPNIGKNYRYYIEAAKYNSVTLEREYYLLLSDTKFNNNCRKCRIDDYARLKLKLKGDIAEYVNDIANNCGNIQFSYIESAPTYDIWQIHY